MLPPVMATPTFLPRNRSGMGQQRGETGGAGALGHRLGAFDQQADGFLDGAFRRDQNAGDAAADHLERDFADVAHGDALGDGGAADRDGPAGEALGHGGVGFDLGAVDGDAGVQRGGGDQAAGEQAAAADRDDQRVEVGDVLQHLQRQRALAGDDAEVVVGVDEHQRMRGGQFPGVGGGFGQGFADQNDIGAPGRGAGDLGRGGEFRHHDGGGDAQQAGVTGDGLGVVAGRHGDDAALALRRATAGTAGWRRRVP